MRAGFSVAAALALLAQAAIAQEAFTVAPKSVADEKAVFATVESANVVPARARIGGTVVELAVKEGDSVKQGQVVATIGDEKLALQMKSLDAQISGLADQVAQAQNDLTRAEDLFSRGTVPKTTLDQARTAFNVASNALKARTAERSVIQQQVTEGKVLAPTSGRVLKVPVTTGTVILPGEPVATVAEQNFILRLRVPERHARFLKAGDSVRIDGEELGKELGKEPRKSGAQFGTIRLVYPQIEDGRVIADAAVAGLGDYFVGERIRVWVSAGERDSIIVPASFIVTRFGIDYARVRKDGKSAIDVPVQRGRELPRPDMPDALEILSGLHNGDVLVHP
jgi:RND family efflux transporter MFP subunit